MTGYTFKAYDYLTEQALGFLPDFSSCVPNFEFSEVGSIKFDYTKNGTNSDLLFSNGRVEIAVLQDGVELDDGRFIVNTRDYDEVEPDEDVPFNGVSLLKLLDKAIVYSQDGSVTQGIDQLFNSATPGGILQALFTQNYNRGAGRVMRRITYGSFSNTLDSDGNPWALSYGTITYRVGTTYLSVIRNMVSNGMIEVKMVGRDLRVYNAGGLGVDRTAQAEPVIFRRGREIEQAPVKYSNENIAAVALVGGDEGILAEFQDAPTGTAWGYDEVFVSQGGIKDAGTLTVLGNNFIDSAKQPRVELTHRIATEASPYVPMTDYRVSDYVYTDRSGSNERVRIRQMVLGIEPDGVVTCDLVLNDKFLEQEIVNARRIEGILGGSNAEGSVAVPTPEPETDDTIPSTPTGQSASSNSYVETDGVAWAAATVNWAPVTTNTNSSTITDLSHYEVQYKTAEPDTLNPPTTLGNPLSGAGPYAREEQAYTKLFDRRGKGYGWLGADAMGSARAASGKDFWAGADTNLGTADGSGRISQWSFLHNTFVLTDENDPTFFEAHWGYKNALSKEDAWLETTIGQWVSKTNCSVARSATQFKYGTHSLQITATAGGDATAGTTDGASGYAVTVGQTYSVMAHVKQTGTVRDIALAISWYNGATFLSTSTSSNFSGGSTTSWIRHVFAATAPASATHCSLRVIVKSAAASQVVYADCLGLFAGDARYQGWVDPARGQTGPVAIMNPEAAADGTAAITGITNNIFWVDNCFARNGKIYVFYTRYTPSGTFLNETYLAEFDGTTHYFERIRPFRTSDVFVWGNATYDDGTHVYIFGLENLSGGNRANHLARVPVGNIFTVSPEYWTASGWDTVRANSIAVFTTYGAYIGGVTFLAGLYQAIVIVYGSGQVTKLTANAITGTWSSVGNIYTQPQQGSGQVAYFPRIHRQLDDPAKGILMSYSVNGTVQSEDSLDNIRFYAPKFFIGPPSAVTPGEPTSDWSQPVAIATSPPAHFSKLFPGENFIARIRAVDNNGNVSGWAVTSAINLVSDTTPPNKPSKPIVTNYFQGIRVEWDGLDYQGGIPPADWFYLEVHMSLIDNFTPSYQTQVDIIITSEGSVSPIMDLIYGKTYYVRFVAVDKYGNKSEASDVASATPEQIVNVDEIANKIITGAKVADGTINVRNLTVGAFDPNILPNGNFEEATLNADGSPGTVPAHWQSSGWIWGSGATIEFETIAPLAGARSLKLTMANDTSGMRYASAKFPVTPGQILYLKAVCLASRIIAANVIEFHIVTGVTESDVGTFPGANSDWGFAVAQSFASAVPTVVEGQRVVPANMRWAQVFASATPPSDAGGGWSAYFDDIEVRPVGGSAAIADASIINAKIANLAVNDAKIANVSAGKITVGVLIADITVSARIKTADTGARVELNGSGIQAFNSSGQQTVDISASTGGAVFTGWFRSGFTGSQRIEIGDTPTNQIYFWPASGSNVAYINSFQDSGITAITANTGTYTSSGATVRSILSLGAGSGIQLSQRRTSDGALWGGGIQLDGRWAIMQIGPGGLWVDNDGGDGKTWVGSGAAIPYTPNDALYRNVLYLGNDVTFHHGVWENYVDRGAKQGLIMGSWPMNSATSWSFGWATTKTGTMHVAATPVLGSAVAWASSGMSNTGFSIIAASTVSGTIHFWAWRSTS